MLAASQQRAISFSERSKYLTHWVSYSFCISTPEKSVYAIFRSSSTNTSSYNERVSRALLLLTFSSKVLTIHSFFLCLCRNVPFACCVVVVVVCFRTIQHPIAYFLISQIILDGLWVINLCIFIRFILFLFYYILTATVLHWIIRRRKHLHVLWHLLPILVWMFLATGYKTK